MFTDSNFRAPYLRWVMPLLYPVYPQALIHAACGIGKRVSSIGKVLFKFFEVTRFHDLNHTV